MNAKSESQFDFDAIFSDDYLHFYEPDFTPERNEREAGTIVRLLSLQEGQSVLDLGCGHGRISLELARQGYAVTGLDANTMFLNIAEERGVKAGLQVDFVEGDMRSLSWDSRFDAVVIWFTTFGYFSDEDNIQVLKEVAKVLKPGGKLLIEQMYRNALLRRDFPVRVVYERGDDLLIDIINYNPHTDRNETQRVIVRNGEVRRSRFNVRLYGLPEIAYLLKEAGFQSVKGYGQGGGPLTAHDKRLMVLAER